MTNSNPAGTSKSSQELVKIQKNLKTTGDSVRAVGWVTLVISVSLYLWSMLDKSSYLAAHLPAVDLPGTFIMAVASSLFIILGNRVRGLNDVRVNRYLQVLLGVSLALLGLIIWSGGRAGIVLFFIIAYLISGLVSIHKAMKIPEFTATLTTPDYTIKKTGWIIFIILAGVLFFGSFRLNNFLIARQLDTGLTDTTTKADTIKQLVLETKAAMTLPLQIDANTKIVDITAEKDTFRYHYILTGVDPSILSNDFFRNFLLPNVCKNKDLLNILNKDVAVEYFYVVQETSKTYLISFTKDDCAR